MVTKKAKLEQKLQEAKDELESSREELNKLRRKDASDHEIESQKTIVDENKTRVKNLKQELDELGYKEHVKNAARQMLSGDGDQSSNEEHDGSSDSVEAAEEQAEENKRKAERLRNQLQRANDGNGGSTKNTSGSNNGDTSFNSIMGWYFFLLPLAAHLIDGWFYDYKLTPQLVAARVVVYCLFTALPLTLFILQATGRKAETIWAVALLEVLGPFILVLINKLAAYIPYAPGLQTLKWFYFFTPIFALYFSAQTGRKLLVLWIGLMIYFTLTLTIQTFILGGTFPQITSDLAISEAVTTVNNRFWNGIQSVYTGILTGAKQGIRYATGNYYKGMVERQQNEPVGVYIEETRIPRDVYFAGDEVTYWADMRGKSFQKQIQVQTSCAAQRQNDQGGGKTYTGTTVPQSFTIFAETFKSVQCNLGTLPPGKYETQFTAGFNFRTWSYVTYTFVDQQTRRNYFSMEQDINEALNIPTSLSPTYTPGPVMLGMSSDIPQPVGIDRQRGLNTLFGITLDNRWTDGSIQRVKQFDVLIPQEFKLTKCDASYKRLKRDPLCKQQPNKCSRDMRVYRFNHPDTIGRFTTFNCRLRLANGIQPSDVIQPGQKKARKTFVVKARYDYALTEDATIQVNER